MSVKLASTRLIEELADALETEDPFHRHQRLISEARSFARLQARVAAERFLKEHPTPFRGVQPSDHL